MPYKTFLRKSTLKNLYNIIMCALIFSLGFMQWAPRKTLYANTPAENIKLPILMYHGFTKGGKASEYVIDVSDFEKDIIYLKKNGFSFIDTHDLADYVYSGTSLPSKPVMITFDDGYLNNYTYAYPIIKKHNIKVVISPIAYYVEYYSLREESDPLYTQLTTKEINEMQSSGLVDFQNHSYNMHSLESRKGSSMKKSEKSEDYIREFYYDLKAAENVLEDITGKKTHAYIYPFGSYSKESLAILKCSGYKITMRCEEGFNFITKDKECLYMLKRFNRTPERNAEQILSQY